MNRKFSKYYKVRAMQKQSQKILVIVTLAIFTTICSSIEEPNPEVTPMNVPLSATLTDIEGEVIVIKRNGEKLTVSSDIVLKIGDQGFKMGDGKAKIQYPWEQL